MSAQAGRLAGWPGALGAAWAWWRDGIALPDSVRRGLNGGDAIVTIDIESDAVVLRRFSDGRATELARLPHGAFDAAALRQALAGHGREPVALRLPDRIALTRRLALPLAARRNIASLLDIELERQSPLERDAVYHDYRIEQVDRAAGRVYVTWRIVKRAQVDPLLAICRQAGVQIAAVAFVGDAALPDGGDFPVDGGAAARMRLRRWLVPGLVLLVAVLLAAVVAGAYARNQDAADAFDARVAQLRIAARGSLALEHAIAEAQDRERLLLAEKQRPGAARVLAETTRVLPDGSWLTGFTVADGEVRVQGYSNAASSLIALFDASPLFASAEFRAPLTQAGGPGLEQFDLAFKLRPGVR